MGLALESASAAAVRARAARLPHSCQHHLTAPGPRNRIPVHVIRCLRVASRKHKPRTAFLLAAAATILSSLASFSALRTKVDLSSLVDTEPRHCA